MYSKVQTVVLFAALLFPVAASAAPISVTVTEVTGANQSAKLTAKATLLASLGQYTILEDFEGPAFTASSTTGHTTLATGAGTFSFVSGHGTGAACIKPGGASNSACDALYVLDSTKTPFSGRFNTTPGGNRWLDSNDTKKVALDLEQAHLNQRLETLFFFLTDVNDQGGRLKVYGFDGLDSEFDVFGSGVSGSTPGNGALYFVQLASLSGISRVEWVNNAGGDGWGIDDIGTQSVPEPTELMLLGAALFGTSARLRRRRA